MTTPRLPRALRRPGPPTTCTWKRRLAQLVGWQQRRLPTVAQLEAAINLELCSSCREPRP